MLCIDNIIIPFNDSRETLITAEISEVSSYSGPCVYVNALSNNVSHRVFRQHTFNE